MDQTAFKMKLKPGFKDEYKRRHDKIWPELQALLTAAGIRDYSIFLDEETNTLFAVQKNSSAGLLPDLSSNVLVRKWWDYMADIMETYSDNSPVVKPLAQMFHMD